jgi:predicted dehydrogenase
MINVGVIGYGYWGPNLVRNLFELEDANMTICCDLRNERLAAAQRRFPTLQITTDYRDVMASPKVDAVVIATPISTHFALAKEALSNGKHVLVEKPLTSSSTEAEELVKLSQKKAKVLMVDHTFIYTGAVQRIKELITSGELGKVYYYDSVRVNLGLFQSDTNVVWDLATHDISIMDYLINEKPKGVSAVGVCHVGNDLENIAYITVRYADNLIGHIHVNWLAPVKIRRTLIAGSEKMVVYDDLEPSEKVKVYDQGVNIKSEPDGLYRALVDYRMGDMYAPKVDRTEALSRVCQHFIDCIQKGDKPITDGVAGLNVVRILEASQRSIKNRGQEVSL